MSPERSGDKGEEPSPFCPQCGSEDTVPIHQEPPAAADPGKPKGKEKEQAWFRCLTCRYKWKEGDEL